MDDTGAVGVSGISAGNSLRRVGNGKLLGSGVGTAVGAIVGAAAAAGAGAGAIVGAASANGGGGVCAIAGASSAGVVGGCGSGAAAPRGRPTRGNSRIFGRRKPGVLDGGLVVGGASGAATTGGGGPASSRGAMIGNEGNALLTGAGGVPKLTPRLPGVDVCGAIGSGNVAAKPFANVATSTQLPATSTSFFPVTVSSRMMSIAGGSSVGVDRGRGVVVGAAARSSATALSGWPTYVGV
ncbi:hypothetical protein LBMAG56_09090 [Verrucomicrobiota bacterium]|nr:hypothetical protein LBMAG56_09090 [Verrucomicrobiota bacterium]